MTPNARTMERLREMGYEVAKTEYWHHYAKRTMDLFGFIDTLGVNINRVLAIQSTTGDHHAERVAKIRSLPISGLLVKHWQVEVWSWALQGARGKRKVWKLRRERIRYGR